MRYDAPRLRMFHFSRSSALELTSRQHRCSQSVSFVILNSWRWRKNKSDYFKENDFYMKSKIHSQGRGGGGGGGVSNITWTKFFQVLIFRLFSRYNCQHYIFGIRYRLIRPTDDKLFLFQFPYHRATPPVHSFTTQILKKFNTCTFSELKTQSTIYNYHLQTVRHLR